MMSLIACLDKDNGIGKDGTIPWSLPPDMKYFKKITLDKVIIMGRNTWESIGSKPLPRRVNIVITSDPESVVNHAIACPNIRSAISVANKYQQDIFFIGGYGIYKEALSYVSTVYLTRIDKSFDCDVMFPIDSMTGFIESSSNTEWQYHKDLKYRFQIYDRDYSDFE